MAKDASEYRAARRNAARLDAGRNLALRDVRRRLGLSRKDYDRMRAMRTKSPVEYGLMRSFLQTKENAMGYVIGPHVRFRLSTVIRVAV